MSTTTKKNQFVSRIKQTGTNLKNKVKSGYNKVKTKVSDYTSTIKSAYDIGYADGFKAAKNIPNTFGSATSASVGYKNGVSDYRKRQKIDKRLKRK